jgi:hypothetical protein
MSNNSNAENDPSIEELLQKALECAENDKTKYQIREALQRITINQELNDE